MTAIITRTSKGSKLTHAEMDQNLNNLNEAKLEGAVLSANNTVLMRDKDGNLTVAVIGEIQILGRLTGGNMKGLTMAELKLILALETNDVAGLDDDLAGKAASVHAHAIADVTDLQTELDGKATDAELLAVSTDLATAENDITALEADVADLEGALNGMSILTSGVDTLVAGVKAVAVPGLLASDRVMCFTQIPGGDVGVLYADPVTADEFTCKSTSNTDVSTFFYLILRASA